MDRGESTESRRSRKGEHHPHSSHVRLDATVIPGPGSEERPSRRHHHTRSGSRGGGQSEHRKPRSHRKSAEDGEDGAGGAGKTGRHKNKGVDGGGEGGEQEGAGDGNERRPRRNRHGNQTEGEGRRMCQHRRKYVHCTHNVTPFSGYNLYLSLLFCPFSILTFFLFVWSLLPISRDCSAPNLSTTRPIQKSLSRQDSQYSEDMDNLMNTKLVSGSPGDGPPNPAARHIVAPGFGSALHLANSGTHGSLVTLDSYGSIAHHRTNSVIRLPHPDYTALDMPIFPSTNAILQSKCRMNMCSFSSVILNPLFHNFVQ